MLTYAGKAQPASLLGGSFTGQAFAVVTVLQAGIPAVVYSSRLRAGCSNPLPVDVAPDIAGVDCNGDVTFYAEPGEYTVSVVVAGTAPAVTRVWVAADPAEPVADAADSDYWPRRAGLGFAVGSSMNSMPAAQIAADMDLARRAGGDMVRADMAWDFIETAQGVFNWTQPDAIFDAADAAGMRVLFIILGTPAWARTAGEATRKYPPTNLATLAAFATAAVSRYRYRGAFGCRAWEVWNEPNNSSHFWDPTAYASFVGLQGAAYTAIKAADPKSVVVMGSLLRGGLENWTTSNLDTHWLTQAYAAGLAGKFDALGYHPYSHGYDPLALTPTGEPTGSEFVTNPTFDVDTSAWTATNSTLTRVTTPVRSGAGALQIAAIAGAAQSKASALPALFGITAGLRYIAQVWVRAATVGEPMVVQFDWRDTAGSYLSSNVGYSAVDTTTGWTLLTVRGNAPATCTRVSIVITTAGSATAGRVHYADDVSLKLASDESHGWNRMHLIRAIMVANGDVAKPIWITETGQHTGTAPTFVSEATQATYLTNAVKRLRTFPYVERTMWYSLRDIGTDPAQLEQNYGLVKNDGVTFKAAYAAFLDANS